MIIYNVTVGVDKRIEQDWLVWMREIHIPDVMRTNMFLGHKMYKILTTDTEETVSYAIQYSAVSLNEIERYLEEFAPALREEVNKKFGEQQAAFRTLLEEI
ncbi:MAG: DUF4286 family protein [Cyclobacteriaceae bacterium]|jgi:hypothetical protein|nr:DUF4286 domain-containing protein [Cytophagales bacterium]HNP76432.1 DUF4286 family protein [Cyclobacteriaceae bacterium]HQQ98049.1 DUF4286 family protein [Cyclobacteriaceae bacterium]